MTSYLGRWPEFPHKLCEGVGLLALVILREGLRMAHCPVCERFVPVRGLEMEVVQIDPHWVVAGRRPAPMRRERAVIERRYGQG